MVQPAAHHLQENLAQPGQLIGMVSQYGGSQGASSGGGDAGASSKGVTSSKRFQRFASLFSRIPKIQAGSSGPLEVGNEEEEDGIGVLMSPKQRDEAMRQGFLSFSGTHDPRASSPASPSPTISRQQSQGLAGSKSSSGFAQALAARAKSFSSRQAPHAGNGSMSAGNSMHNNGGSLQLPAVNHSYHPGMMAYGGMSGHGGLMSPGPGSRHGGSQHASRKQAFMQQGGSGPVSQHGYSNSPAPLLIPVACLDDDMSTPRDALPTPPSASARAHASFRRASSIIDRSIDSISLANIINATASRAGSQDNLAGMERLPSGSVLNILTSPEMTAAQEPRRPRVDSRLLAVSPTLPASMQRPAYLLEDYTLTAKLHASNTCTVYKAFCKWSMTIVVLKVGARALQVCGACSFLISCLLSFRIRY